MPSRSLLYVLTRAVLAVLLISLPLSACSKEKGPVRVRPPFSSSQLATVDYQTVVSQFEHAGFTNVTTEPIPDLITGWWTGDGEVEEIIIDGSATFMHSDTFSPDVTVVVRYHTFPEKAPTTPEPQKPEAPTPTSPSTPEPVATTPAAAQAAPSPTPTEPAILTPENNTDLAALLVVAEASDPSIAEFASTYKGKTIEFDGCVADVAPHGSYKSRFDYLIYAGDYDPDHARGPAFQFSDIDYTGFHFPADAAPDKVHLGMNLHITAQVGEYNPKTDLFQLKPVKTTVR